MERRRIGAALWLAKVVMGQPLPMGHSGGQMGMMKHEGMAGCEMCGGQGMMHCGMGMRGRGMMPPGPMGQLLQLYGDKIEVTVENGKDGAALRITSKDPEVVKAIQVHLAENLVMIKKMREAAATTARYGRQGPRRGRLRRLPDDEEVVRHRPDETPATAPRLSRRGAFLLTSPPGHANFWPEVGVSCWIPVKTSFLRPRHPGSWSTSSSATPTS